MKTQAIERIKGYCCEVNQAQWEELVRVADDVGVSISPECRKHGMIKPDRYVRLNLIVNLIGIYYDNDEIHKLIPFPDFLAKLKGVADQWQPKAGERVNISMNGKSWSQTEDEYIAYYCGKHVTKHMTVRGEWIACVSDYVRPLRPTITRSEAEQQLGKQIID